MCLVVHEAKLYRDTEQFGQMDPFVQLTTSEGAKHRTRVLQDAGKSPKWNQLLEIPTRITEQVKVTVYDEDIMMDDFVGECMLSVKEVCAMGDSKPRWFDLNYEGKKSAEIMLSGHWAQKTSSKSSEFNINA